MEEKDTEEELNNEIISTSSTITNSTQQSNIISSQCKICGASALYSNYGAITCSPCKIFFKRNVKKQFKCNFIGQCDININNRHVCSSCRLAKCFACGMQPDLIRCPLSKKINPIDRNKNISTESITATSNILMITNEYERQQIFSTINSVQTDNPTLTNSQSRLLSNLIYSYDESKVILIAQQFMNQYNVLQSIEMIDTTLPKEFFRKIYEITEGYLRSNGDFYTLTSDDRAIFLRNSADNVTCLGSVFCCERSQIYNCKAFVQIFENHYGKDSLILIERVIKHIDSDIVIAKLALSLFTFSINTSIFSSNMAIKSLNTLAIFRIQNTYIDILWKYLLYKYDYYQLIKRFIKLIQCLLAATNTVFDAQNIKQHVNDIESVIEQTEISFVLDDIEHIHENKN